MRSNAPALATFTDRYIDPRVVFYVLSLTMGRVYVTTLLVNLLVSRRATSPYAMPVGVPLRKLSFSAEMMLTFCA